MLPSEKLAIAAHLHVLLRRRTGRVTDTEWMAHNVDYATEIVRFARLRARQDGAPELEQWAGRLEQAVLGTGAPAPRASADSGFPDSLTGGKAVPETPATPRYVGGIR